jgi:hypothetical protein
MPYRRNRVSLRRAVVLAALALSVMLGAITSQAGAATLPTLSVTATATSISVSGAPQSGAVNVVSTATGLKEGAVILLQLKPGVTAAEVVAFLATKASEDPNTANKYGSIVFDTEVATGHPSEAQTTLQAGQYLALLAPGEGPPKANASFTVTQATAPVALPAAQALERTIDFGFKGPSTLHNGELVGFENEGFLVHMNLAFPAKSKKTAKLLLSALRSGKQKQAQKLIAGAPVSFTGPVSSGAYQQMTLSAKPGWYVQVCFMETQDGRDHARLGMERIIKITK